MQLKIDLRAPLKALARDLSYLQRDQIPYAAALALTMTAQDARDVETRALPGELDNPTGFTRNTFGVAPARKANLTALLFARAIQGRYLAPEAFGGSQVLGSKKAILTPRDIATNQYGNLPKGKLVALKGKRDVFIGEVKTKGGVIGGVWQRVAKPGQPIKGRVRGVGAAQGPSRQGRLKLLVQFTRPSTVTVTIPYAARTARTINSRLEPNWRVAIAKALASAR